MQENAIKIILNSFARGGGHYGNKILKYDILVVLNRYKYIFYILSMLQGGD